MDNQIPLEFCYKNGYAFIGEHRIQDLAETYGTPLFILDKKTIIYNCNQFLAPLSTYYPNSKVLYACKANMTTGIAQLMHQTGMNLDVSSGGELFTAIKAGVPANTIYFHGNNKTKEEQLLGIKYGVTFVIDNQEEVKSLRDLNTSDEPISIMIRLKPEIDAHTHDYIKTGQLDSKFGIEKKECHHLIKQIVKDNTFDFRGIHSHIGSQILDSKAYIELIDSLVPYIKLLKDESNIVVKELNCGGGMGIGYVENEPALAIEPFIKEFCTYLKKRLHENLLPEPVLLFEPGRSVIGPAGITLYSVGAIKEISGLKTYAFIDGGMADNPRPIMYQATYTMANGTQKGLAKQVYSVAGKYCESGDILGENIEIETLQPGDLLIVFATGAYNYSMASHYNRNCKPAMILVDDKAIHSLVKRETYEDLIRFDCTLNN